MSVFREPGKLPLRMEAVASPVIPIVADLIRQYPGTISLGQGVVSYGPPPEAFEQLPRFMADPENHKYKPVRGIPALLETLAGKLANVNGIEVGGSSAIVVTAGSNLGFMNAVLAITDPGDEIILQGPYYFNHHMAVAMAGCRPVVVDTDENYQLRLDAIANAVSPRTRAIVTISPNNPTGAVYSAEAIRGVNELCQSRGLYHIHDEAYENFVYDGTKHFSPGSIKGSGAHSISLFSLSKAYGFASWRIGYMVVPEHLLVSIQKIQDTILICPPVVSQYAALGALAAGQDYCRARIQEIAAVRQEFLTSFAALDGLATIPRTEGAFYFLMKLRLNLDSMAIVEKLVREHRVAAIPGSAFGVEDSPCLRVAYGALDRATAADALGRLVKGLKALAAL